MCQQPQTDMEEGLVSTLWLVRKRCESISTEKFDSRK